MFAILNPCMALRSWQRVPYAYITRTAQTPKRLDKGDFDILLLADGLHDIPETETATRLLEWGFMSECAQGERELSPWQEHRSYDNRLMPAMNLQVTGRCNYNCLHCFNATDNHALQSHMDLEQVTDLLDQAQACGIRALTITGGEPMVHKDIRQIVSAIYERDMYINEFNTNGFLITQEFLDYLKPFGIPPTMKISFDGIGYHDVMRNFAGAEQRALEAMRLCIANGFPVMAQVNVSPNNLACIPATMDLLDDTGVHIIRLIRTTEVPRWLENGGRCLEIGEYYDAMLGAVSDFYAKPRTAETIVWQFMRISPTNKTYDLEAVKDIRNSQPLCRGNRSMIAVGANGNVYPCLQMSGIMDDRGVSLGNVFETPLRDILQTGSSFMECVCMSVEQKAAINGKCASCTYFKYCGAGCPAMSVATAYAQRNEFCLTDPDTWKCYFFDNGYYQKCRDALPGFACTSPELEESLADAAAGTGTDAGAGMPGRAAAGAGAGAAAGTGVDVSDRVLAAACAATPSQTQGE